MQKGDVREPMYNEKHLKTKIKSYGGKININFYVCSSVIIIIDSVVRVGKNYYPQVFLEQCKYISKEKNKSKFINDELEISSDEFDEKVYNEEISNCL